MQPLMKIPSQMSFYDRGICTNGHPLCDHLNLSDTRIFFHIGCHYVPSKVYEPESALPQRHTPSMASPTIESDTEPASEVHSSPQANPEKSKAHRHRCRKPTQIVIKQKEFKICREARRTKKSWYLSLMET